MFRRDFLKAFAAAASAAFSGGAAAAAVGTTVAKSAPPAKVAVAASRRTTPQVAITADTSQFTNEINTIRQMLGECRLVKIEEMSLRDGGYTITASYRHDPNGTPTDLDKQWGECLADASIRSVDVSSSYEELDIMHLGGLSFCATTSSSSIVRHTRPVRDITVEYVKGWQP